MHTRCTGSGSLWSNVSLTVGYSGSGNRLSVLNGGTVRDNNYAVVGGNTTASGNAVVISGSGSLWTNAANLTLGNGAGGNSLTVSNGGAMAVGGTVEVGYLGTAPNNTVLLTGANSRWNCASDFTLGDGSTGNQISLANGAVLTVGGNAILGYGFDSGADNNTAIVAGGGSAWTNTGTMTVGAYAAGNSLTIANGGVVSGASDAAVGSNGGGNNNSVLVNGSGSTWANSGTLTVGGNGINNNFTVTNNASASAGAVVVGSGGGVTGNQINLASGSLAVANTLEVRNGTVNLNGGSLTANSLLATNNSASATNAVVNFNSGTLTTYGAQVSAPAGGNLAVGNTAGQTATWNLPGGTNNVITPSGYNTTLGNTAGAVANVMVSGSGTLWSHNNGLFVGYATNANNSQLTITNGAQLSDGKGEIGYDGATNSVFVTDANSLWSNSGMLVVGDHTAGNQLTIANGAQVNNGSGYIGYAATANNNTILVTGTNSSLTNYSVLSVGYGGSANQMIIAKGADVQNVGIDNQVTGIGCNSTANGNSVVVTDPGSRWSFSDWYLTVGLSGSSNSLVITNGGFVSGPTISLIMGEGTAAKNNSIVVTGPGSSLYNPGGIIRIGSSGSGNSLIITNGATVTNYTQRATTYRQFTVGYNGYDRTSASNNSAIVTGPGSLLYIYNDMQCSNSIWIGSDGSGSSLAVSNGGRVIMAGTNNNTFLVGWFLDVSNNTVSVTGTNSLLDLQAADMQLGIFASGNQVAIANGGVVSNVNAYIGCGYPGDPSMSPASPNNAVTVSGPGALWNNSSNLFLSYGSGSTNNQLTISNGGQVRNLSADIGYGGGNNTIVVTGTHSLWNNAGTFMLDDQYGGNQLTISNGGQVRNTSAEIGHGGGNNTVFVAGANSLWNNSGTLTFGDQFGGNQLTISNGGAVSNADASVGTNGGNNTIIVTDINSVWNTAGNLTIGYAAGNNQMAISNGAQVIVSGQIEGSRTSGNTITVTGSGSVLNNAGASGSQQFDIDGLVVSDGATVTNGVTAYAGNGLVTGNHSSWNVGNNLVGSLTVDGSGAVARAVGLFSGQCILTNGGQLFSAGGTVRSENLQVVATGNGSVWSNTGGLILGSDNSGVQMTVANGGVITCAGSLLGKSSNNGITFDNHVLVTDPGSLWHISGNLTNGGAYNQSITVSNSGAITVGGNIFVGQANGDYNLQMIVSGGSLDAGGFSISNSAAKSGNAVGLNYGTLTTRGSGQIIVSPNSNLTIGNTPGQMAMWNVLGGTNSIVPVSGYTANTILGNSNGAAGHVLVSGAGTVWTNSGVLYVGGNGAGSQLVLTNNGTVDSAAGYLGNNASASNSTVLVTGSGSVWNNSGSLVVGNAGLGNTLTIAQSGQVVNESGYLGGNAGNNRVVVTDGGSVWKNTGDLIVGNAGAGNQLTITNGGVVTGSGSYVGYNSNASNNTMLVTGSGSLWSSSRFLILGYYYCGGNQLTLANGGTVAAPVVMVGYSSAPGNGLTVAGGNLYATNAAGTGSLTVNYGALTLNSGTVVANSFTNGGALNIGLSGNGANGHVTVSGSAQLGGTLTVTNLNGFQPALSNAFTLVTATSVSGSFATTNLPALGGGLGWNLAYAPTSSCCAWCRQPRRCRGWNSPPTR